MDPKKNIIWLASYPKSGNTWLRVLLSNYLNETDQAIDINNIDASIISSSRTLFDSHCPYLASDLTFDEIDNLRPLVYSEIAKESDACIYIKTHDAAIQNANNLSLFPEENTKLVIHIVRNPLDVCVSYAYHSNISINKSVKSLNSHISLSSSKWKLGNQLRQNMLSWTDHYKSWKGFKAPYLLVKYEDLILDTEKEFARILEHIYTNVDVKKLKNAVALSTFKNLKKQEQEDDFKEKPINAKSFFRKGKSDAWEDEMTKSQIQNIVENNKDVMLELDYI